MESQSLVTKTAPLQEDHAEAVMPRSLPLELVRREYELGRAQLEALARRLQELEKQLRRLETTAPSSTSPQADAGAPLCDLISAMVREVEAPQGIGGARRSHVRRSRGTVIARAARQRWRRLWLIIAAGLLLMMVALIWQLL